MTAGEEEEEEEDDDADKAAAAESGRPRRDGGGLLLAAAALSAWPAPVDTISVCGADIDDEANDEDDESDGNEIAGESAPDRLRRPVTDAVAVVLVASDDKAAEAVAAVAFAATALAAVMAARADRFRFADATREPFKLPSALAMAAAAAEEEGSAVA